MKPSKPKDDESENDLVDEGEIRRFMRYQIIENLVDLMSSNEIYYEFIKLKKCDIIYAKKMFEKMCQLGLGLCQNNLDYTYSIHQFANLRGYVQEDELSRVNQAILLQQQKMDEFERKFMEKYGSDEYEWSEETLKKYEAMDLN